MKIQQKKDEEELENMLGKNNAHQTKKELGTRELMQEKSLAFCIFGILVIATGMLYQSSILNTMLHDYYGLEPDKSTLFYTLGGVGFLVAAPVTFILKSRKIMRRRVVF
jgi:predicted MFS family arabinose efflux permease